MKITQMSGESKKANILFLCNLSEFENSEDLKGAHNSMRNLESWFPVGQKVILTTTSNPPENKQN